MQGKRYLEAPWLGMAGFFSIALMLSLLIFIGEAVRDALDPRKTFRWRRQRHGFTRRTRQRPRPFGLVPLAAMPRRPSP